MPIYKHSGKTDKTLRILKEQTREMTKTMTDEQMTTEIPEQELLTDRDVEKATNLDQLAKTVNMELEQLDISREELEEMSQTTKKTEIMNDFDMVDRLTEGQTETEQVTDYVERMLREADKMTESTPVLQDLKDILGQEIEAPQYSPITPVKTNTFEFPDLSPQTTQIESPNYTPSHFTFPEQQEIDRQMDNLTNGAEKQEQDLTNDCKIDSEEQHVKPDVEIEEDKCDRNTQQL